jgi:glutamate mutase epsilon subunit
MSLELGSYVAAAAARGEVVVQPRMGMGRPELMAAGLRAVADCGVTTAGTITIDSYTRVGDHESVRRALRDGGDLNGFPIAAWGPEVTARVAAAATTAERPVPVQVRHGSSRPGAILRAATAAGLAATEGGPVSYCLPYGRTPLAESVAHWRDAATEFAEVNRAAGRRAHLETFGGCLLGQLCPPSLLIAMSLLESLFFVGCGIDSVSLSYAQQVHAGQDAEALAALRALAREYLPSRVEQHLVLYTYMGVYPRTAGGAERMLAASAELAAGGGAERLIVKTAVEARRIPTIDENVAALVAAGRRAGEVTAQRGLPVTLDPTEVLAEARRLVDGVLELDDDPGTALLAAFRRGLLDVPYCLHLDNHGRTQGMIDERGRLAWARTGRLPLSSTHRPPAAPVSAAGLLTMLRHAAQEQDRLALALAPAAATTPLRVAVVGTGPRGLAVLERLAARLGEQPVDRPVELHAIDAVEVGCGRIWRTDQPDWFLMNTPAGEVTMFSGPPGDGPARPGAGPSLAQWWAGVDPGRADPNAYAPRAVYGRYLRFVCDAVQAHLPAGVDLHRRQVRVERIVAGPAGGYRLTTSDGRILEADRVVLTTGHPVHQPAGEQRRWADFAAAHPPVRYLPGDSAADLPLDTLAPGGVVGVLGLGLSFYDVLAALTIGRGGRFVVDDGAEPGRLRYVPSGREPRIVAGSRSGVPLLARGRNEKPAEYSYRPRLFTVERMVRARRRGRLDFDRDVLPWLRAEVELVYYETALRQSRGAAAAGEFAERVVAAAQSGPPTGLAELAQLPGPGEPPDLAGLARPFAGREFAGPAEFEAALADLLHQDLAAAELGNASGPLKAALDVLRDVRPSIRAAVDFGGLAPASHRDDFLAGFGPLASLLAAGPPRIRLHQVLALLRQGLLRIVGPQTRFDPDPTAGAFVVSSPQVAGSAVRVDALIDARIPVPDLTSDTSTLTRGLYADGMVTGYVNAADGVAFPTGGVAVTAAPFHPVRADGEAERGMYVLGIPAEHTRWFTQVGSGRPGGWGSFTADADAIAADLYDAARTEARELVGPGRSR